MRLIARDRKVRKEWQEQWDLLDSPDHKALKDCKVSRVILGLKAPQEQQVHKDHRDPLA
jgi:hypothetical protein